MTPRSLFLPILFVCLGAPLCASADGVFSFSTDPQTVPPGEVSAAITVSASAPVAQTTCLLLSSGSPGGEFSSSAANWSAVSAVTMSKNTSNRSFYYQDPAPGTYTLTVKVAPKPDSVSSSCASWSDAAGAVQSTITQSIIIDSGGAPGGSQPLQTSGTSSSSPQTESAATGGNSPPPITARIDADSQSMAGGGEYFNGSAFGTAGAPLEGARYLWNFGDGATAEGKRVFHAYQYPGVYEVVLSAGYNYSSAIVRLQVSAIAAAVKLLAEGDGSLTVVNNSTSDIDAGGWMLEDGGKLFTIPESTLVLAGRGLRFAPSVTGLVGTPDARLLYPNGVLAAAAGVSKTSPLRGQTVDVPSTVVQPARAAAQPAASEPGLAAAVTAGLPAPHETLWTYLLGLAALVALGAAGAYYARLSLPAQGETAPTAEEFEIE